MKILWAPWRIKYIQNIANIRGCILCKIAKSKEDKKNHILKRGKYSYVVLNKFPYSNAHLMIVPFKHIGKLKNLDSKTILEMFKFIVEMTELIKKKMKSDGFNIGINMGKSAGAGIRNHIHIHIVPRWSGDTNFMPVLGEVKVIPQSLDDVYELLSNEK